MEPKFQKFKPKFQKLKPRFQKLKPRFQKFKLRFQKFKLRFEKLKPKFRKLKLRFEKLEPEFEKFKPRFRKLKPHNFCVIETTKDEKNRLYFLTDKIELRIEFDFAFGNIDFFVSSVCLEKRGVDVVLQIGGEDFFF